MKAKTTLFLSLFFVQTLSSKADEPSKCIYAVKLFNKAKQVKTRLEKIELLEQGAKVCREFPALHYNLGLNFLAERSYNKAAKVLEIAYGQQKDESIVYAFIEALIKTENISRATKIFNLESNNLDRDLNWYYLKLNLDYLNKNYKLVLENSIVASNTFKDQPYFNLISALSYHKLNEFDSALAQLSIAEDMGFDPFELDLIEGSFLISNKDFTFFERHFNKIASDYPENSKTYYLASFASEGSGDLNTAFQRIKAAYQISPTDVDVVIRYFEILHKKEGLEQALVFFNLIEPEFREDPRILKIKSYLSRF